MNNILLNISAAALQKQLEKEGNTRDHADRSDLDLKIQEERASSSLLTHLTNWLVEAKAAQSRVATPKLKNKIV